MQPKEARTGAVKRGLEREDSNAPTLGTGSRMPLRIA
jgi:hypothetical protein